MTEGGNEEMRGSQKYKNVSILKTKISFLDEVKSIFHNNLRAIIC